MSKNREIPSNFAETMEHHRIKKGISLNKLAETVGVSPAYLSRIKNGKRNAPSVPIAMSIAEELEIPTEQLMTMLGWDVEEVKDLFELISDNDFMVKGQIAEPEMKKAIISILKGILPYIMRGGTKNE